MPLVDLPLGDVIKLKQMLADWGTEPTGPIGVAVNNASGDDATEVNALLQSLRDAGLLEAHVLVDQNRTTFRTERGYRISLGAPVATYLLHTDRDFIITTDGERIKVV